ncbi:hypothetical protein Tco_0824952 [Tanacetum coccineum]
MFSVFSDVIGVAIPTPYYDRSFLTLLRLHSSGICDFSYQEIDAFLALEDDPTSPKVDDSYYDPEGDILLLEAFLNDDIHYPSH